MSKTKEEIIEKIFPQKGLVPYWEEFFTDVEDCMQQYADQQSAEKDKLLKEIDAWLSFNQKPSKEELKKMRKSIQSLINQDHE